MLQKKGTKARKTSAIPGPESWKMPSLTERAASGVTVKKSEQRNEADLAEMRALGRKRFPGFQ